MKKLFLLPVIVFLAFTAKAQIDLGTFLEGGVQDANQLLESYMEPAFVGLGYGLNSGWYNTAKPHKLLGFDLTVTANVSYVPSSAEFFTFSDADYTNVRLSDPSNNQFPTLFGPNLPSSEIPEMTFIDFDDVDQDGMTDDELIRLTGPTGLGLEEDLGFNAVPAPMVQIGLGLIKNTELKLRLLPQQTFGDPGEEFSISMFGLGIMHDIKQWVPGMKLLPFDLSGFIGFTNLKTSFAIDEDAPDQIAELSVNGFTFQGVISKKLSILTVYAGAGFLTSSTDFSLKGRYETESETFTDPINFEFSSGGPKLNFGARLKLLILTLHAEYAFQKYNTFTAGVGLSVR